MKLWLLKNLNPKGYDVTCGFVIAAGSEEAARLLAAQCAGDEESGCWTNPVCSSAVEIAPSSIYTGAEIILRDFKAG